MTLSPEQINSIIENSKSEVLNNPNYRILAEREIQSVWDNLINKKSYFCVYISFEEFDNIDFSNFKIIKDDIYSCIINNNFIEIDRKGDIINKEHRDLDSINMKQELLNRSKKHYVFFLGEKGVTKYANSIQLSDENIFYSLEDRQRYYEKKDISKLEEVIEEYSRSCVSQQVHYMCFMADNATLSQMPDGKKYINRNILKNKPEHFMRDHLREYLNKNMQYTFTIEPELGQTKRELDIFFEVKGETHFIEIKWLGVSIGDTGQDLSTSYSGGRAREGVTQCLEYIDELIHTSEISLRGGYLAIFDARDDKRDIDFQEYKFVKPELKEYLQIFKLLPIINLEKRHAA